MDNMDDLREAMSRIGSSAEDAGAACDKLRDVADALYSCAAAYEIMQEMLRRIGEAFGAYMGEPAELATEPLPPKKAPPRPPLYAGPQNKGRTWTRQPPRLARSCCRKMRR